MTKSIFWFRQDLRLHDNPGLSQALRGEQVLPVYIHDDSSSDYKMGEASRWWLHHSLSKLNKKLGNKLNIYKGNSKEVILQLVKDQKIDAVYWNRCYEPWRISQDTEIKASLIRMGLTCETFNSSLLQEPWEVKKTDGTTYKVFTPYYQKGYTRGFVARSPISSPSNLNLLHASSSLELKELELLPDVPWYKCLESHWCVGEDGAQERLSDFLKNELSGYKNGRNFPSKRNISRLSPHLHFGEISINQVWHAVQGKRMDNLSCEDDIHAFLTELVWREFSYHLLYHFPELPHKNFQAKFDNFPWQHNDKLLKAWQTGQTGYPIVDAGMRELWQTGYMHNRVRMIVGSFLVKNLLLHWCHGANWFWDCLVDADLANNSASWQWVSGSGADAAPYFRIFNPVMQGEKFDHDGSYTRRFIPEIAKLPDAYLFKPWEAPPMVLQHAGVILGKTYPTPIVDLGSSRRAALEAHASLKNSIAKDHSQV